MSENPLISYYNLTEPIKDIYWTRRNIKMHEVVTEKLADTIVIGQTTGQTNYLLILCIAIVIVFIIYLITKRWVLDYEVY